MSVYELLTAVLAL